MTVNTQHIALTGRNIYAKGSVIAMPKRGQARLLEIVRR